MTNSQSHTRRKQKVDPRMRTEIDRIVGENIRSHRARMGLTQQRLARKVGVSFQQIQRYESGANRVCVSRLLLLSEVLETPLDDLIAGARTIEQDRPRLSPHAHLVSAIIDGVPEVHRGQFLSIVRGVARSFEAFNKEAA